MLGDEDLNAYKYNEEKTLSWLQRKTERVAEVLKQKGIHVSGGAVSATFVKSGKPDPSDSGKPKTNMFTYLTSVCRSC
jgi:ribonuclease H2 subunit B